MTLRQTLARRGVSSESQVLVALVALGLAIIVGVVIDPMVVPFTSLMVPLLLGSILLSPRRLPPFVLFIIVLLFVALSQQVDPTPRTFGAVTIQVLMALIVLVASMRRSPLGVGGAAGESMFVDLRDRISRQTGFDGLPAGWYAESALESAGGTAFAGDFFVATRPSDQRLEVALVDVSGKGEEAGARALQLSGAFGGLLGALPAGDFLTAANDYLLRQDWEEGFATAIHLSVDLRSGRLRGPDRGPPAGGAAARRLRALGGAGERGPDPRPHRGRRRSPPPRGRCAAVTPCCSTPTGWWRLPRRDIDMGIDRMLGELERLVRDDLAGSTQRLVDGLGSRSDDRALLLLQRS